MKTPAARQMPLKPPQRLLRAYATAADLGPCTMVRRARHGPLRGTKSHENRRKAGGSYRALWRG